MNIFYIPDPEPFWFVGSELLADLFHAEIAKVNELGEQHGQIARLFDFPEASVSQRRLCFAVLAHGKVLEIISELFASRYEPSPPMSEEESRALNLTGGLPASDAPDWVLEMDRVVDRLAVHLKDALPDPLRRESYNAVDPVQMSAIESAAKTLDTVENLRTWIEGVLDQQMLRLLRRWTPVTAERESPKPKHWLKGTQGLTRKADLSRYLHGLTEKQQLAASLKWEYGLGLSEIASRMGISRKTTIEHIDAARRKIDQATSNEKHKPDLAKSTKP
jgi:DNA-directed RNA polymerase specialized sigma24 family protein